MTLILLFPDLGTAVLNVGQSTSIDFNNGLIETALISVTFTGNTPTLFMTADGTNFESVTNNVKHIFTNSGTDLKWKVESLGTIITNIKIQNYK